MAITFTIDVPGDEQVGQHLDDIRRHLGISGDADVADGMLAHLESRTATGYRIVDVWESEDAFECFFAERLSAAFDAAGYRPIEQRPQVEQVVALAQRTSTGTSASTGQHDGMLRELMEAFSHNDPRPFDRYLSRDFVDHEVMGDIPPTRDGVKQTVAGMHLAFEHFTMTPLDVFSAPGRGVARNRVTGRHTGTFLGIPATGREIDVECIDLFAIGADGLVHEHWGLTDVAALMAQLGVPAQAGAPTTTRQVQA
ncbi:MAG: ester cyclase [Motilibacteraceae bacterium]